MGGIKKSLRKTCEALKKEPQQLGLLLQNKDARSRVCLAQPAPTHLLSQGILAPSRLLAFPRARGSPGQARVPLCCRAWGAAGGGPKVSRAQAAP